MVVTVYKPFQVFSLWLAIPFNVVSQSNGESYLAMPILSPSDLCQILPSYIVRVARNDPWTDLDFTL